MSEGMEATMDAGISESPVIESTETVETPDLGQETDVTEVQAEQEQPETEQPEESLDGRKLPDAVKRALKQLSDADPNNKKVVQELRKSFFEHSAYRQAFPTAGQAQQAKAALDLIGGTEGLANVQSQVAAMEAVDQSFENGDPAVIDDVVSDFPEGFKKLMPYAMEKLGKLDPEAYAKAIQPHLFSQLQQAGLGDVLDHLFQSISNNDLEAAKRLLGDTRRWYEGQKNAASQKQGSANDPERSKFEEERKQFQSERETAFRQDIGRQTVQHVNGQIEKALVPYLKQRNLGSEARKDLVDGINAEITRLLKADAGYQGQTKALFASKNRNSAGIVSYINAASSEAVPKAVKAVWQRRYGSVPAAKPAQKTENPNPAPPDGQPLMLKQKPDRAHVDWDRTPDTMFIASRANTKKDSPYKGRMVRWQ